MRIPLYAAIEVQRSGSSRLRVRGCDDAKVAAELAAWLRAQPHVTSVWTRSESATIDVTLDRGDRLSALVRDARDQAFVLTRPERPVWSRRVSVTHAMKRRARIAVSGLNSNELAGLSTWLSGRPGIASATPGATSVVVHWKPKEQADAEALARAIGEAKPSEWPRAHPRSDPSPWPALLFDSAVLVAARRSIGRAPGIAVAVAISALPTARRTKRALDEHRLSVDLLDLIAILVSVAVGKPGTAALITWLLAIGDSVLYMTKRRAHGALAGAVKLEVESAWRILADGQTERVATKALRAGDRILCDLGARLPADGVIRSGTAMLDTKSLTGESMPRTHHPGDEVMASSVVVEGSIVVEVRRIGRDTTTGRIVQILESATEKPTEIQRETARVADRLVIPTLGLAGASALLASEIDRLTSVLITDFGSGIRISVPTSALAAMTLATREGVLLKGGQFLERLSRTDAIIFDKTGTVTNGTPRIVDVAAVGTFDPREAIALAAAVETRQNHPVAEALRAYAESASIALPDGGVRDQRYAVGQGLVARCGAREVTVGGKRLMTARAIDVRHARPTLERHERASISSLLIAIDGRLAAVLGYADTLRPESPEVIRALQGRGRRRVILMSGDASGTAEAVGRRLGVDEVFSELLPHEKAEQVKNLQREGKTVAMVGDGINDAPALALADVGISLTGGTDLALDAADVVLLRGGLSKLPDAFRLADRAMRSVRIGLGLVIAPNALAIVLGAVGVIGPAAATVMNNGSTVVAALAAVAPALRRRCPR